MFLNFHLNYLETYIVIPILLHKSNIRKNINTNYSNIQCIISKPMS